MMNTYFATMGKEFEPHSTNAFIGIAKYDPHVLCEGRDNDYKPHSKNEINRNRHALRSLQAVVSAKATFAL